MSRRVTDAVATQIMACGKSIHSTPDWKLTGNGDLRTDMDVVSTMGEHLHLGGRISAKYAGKSTWWLLWGSKEHGECEEQLRRLDIRGSHSNPDGERWERRTHKHLWSVELKNEHAYTPDDIPHDQPGTLVTRDNYREIFEAFAAECGIETGPDYLWSEPIFKEQAGQKSIWEVQ